MFHMSPCAYGGTGAINPINFTTPRHAVLTQRFGELQEAVAIMATKVALLRPTTTPTSTPKVPKGSIGAHPPSGCPHSRHSAWVEPCVGGTVALWQHAQVAVLEKKLTADLGALPHLHVHGGVRLSFVV
jgi:hypothetical protein